MRKLLFITLAFTLLLPVASLAGPDDKCSSTAQECERQIRSMMAGRKFLGLTLQDARHGVRVVRVVPNSAAARAGFAIGDRIVSLEGRDCTSATIRTFKKILNGVEDHVKLSFIVDRAGTFIRINARPQPYTTEQIDQIIAAHLREAHSGDKRTEKQSQKQRR